MSTELVASLRLRLHDEVSGEARRIEHAMRSAAGGAASATEVLRLKQIEAGTAVRTLSAHFRQLQSSGKATEQELREVATALVRARESAAGFAREARELAASERQAAQQASAMGTAVQQASTRTAAGADRTATAVRGVSAATKNQGRDLGGMVNVVAEMGYSFGTAIPQARGFGMQLAMMGGTAYQLGAAFGPVGVVIGVVVGLLPSLISFFSGAGDEAEQLTQRTQDASASFQELRDRIRQMREDAQRSDDAERGRLGIEEQEVELETQRSVLRQQQARERQLFAAVHSDRRGIARQQVASGRTSVDQVAADVAEREIARLEAAGTPVVNREIIDRDARMVAVALREPLQRIMASRSAQGSQAEHVGRLESGLETARATQRQTEETEAIRSAPQRIRTQLEDLATVGNLSPTQRAQLLTSAERGRAFPEGITRQLGRQAGRARELAGSLTTAERAAASSRLEEAAGENLVLGLPEAAPPPAREQIRRAVRSRMPGGPSTQAPGASPDLSSGSLATLERLAGPRRVEVDVRVSDDRVRVTTRDVDASAADITGGQG